MNEFWNKRTRGVIEGTIEGLIGKMPSRFVVKGHLPGLRRRWSDWGALQATYLAPDHANASAGFLLDIGPNREQLKQRKGGLLPLMPYFRLKYSASSLAMISSVCDMIEICMADM